MSPGVADWADGPPTVPVKFGAFMAMDGADMELTMERTAEFETVAATDALLEPRAEMALWVATRILRAIDAGSPPRRVTVHIRVELDADGAQTVTTSPQDRS